MEANFVEHPGEIHDAASPVVGAAGNGVLSRCLHGAGETERKLLAVLRKSNPLTRATQDPLALHPSATRARKASPAPSGLAKPGLRFNTGPYRPWRDDYRLLLAGVAELLEDGDTVAVAVQRDCCGDSKTADGAFAGCGVTEAAQRACADRLNHWKTTNDPPSRSMTSIATSLRFILPL